MTYPNRVWIRCTGIMRIALLAIAVMVLNWSQTSHGADDAHKWLVTLHKNGEETARAVIPVSKRLHEEMNELRERCMTDGVVDFNSYAPSVRIESELERIDLRAKTIVYSTRKKADGIWYQRSVRASESDNRLRQRVLDYVNEVHPR